MQRLRARHQPLGPGPQGAGEGVPPELLHLPRVQEAAVHRRGVVRAG